MFNANDFPLIAPQVVAEHSHLVIPSLPNWIEPAVDYLRQKAILCGACEESRSGKLLVALHEAITNAIVHGNLGVSSALKERGDSAFAQELAQRAADPVLAERNVDIVVTLDRDLCRWIITDQGDGFDVEAVLARCLSDDPEVLLASGRGILMMKSFLDDVRFELGGRRVVLSLQRRSGAEQRRAARVSVNVPFQITPIAPDGTCNWTATYEAVSRNVSESGIALLQDQLAQTQRILIGIPRGGEIFYIPAEVKHTRSLGSHGMELGCQFLDATDAGAGQLLGTPIATPLIDEVQEAVAGLIAEFQANQSPDERRVYARIVFNVRILVRRDGQAEPYVCYARDISKGGIAMIAHEPIGGDVTIALVMREDQTPLKIRCRVVRCSRIQDRFYDIGATFLRLDHRPEATEKTP